MKKAVLIILFSSSLSFSHYSPSTHQWVVLQAFYLLKQQYSLGPTTMESFMGSLGDLGDGPCNNYSI